MVEIAYYFPGDVKKKKKNKCTKQKKKKKKKKNKKRGGGGGGQKGLDTCRVSWSNENLKIELIYSTNALQVFMWNFLLLNQKNNPISVTDPTHFFYQEPIYRWCLFCQFKQSDHFRSWAL